MMPLDELKSWKVDPPWWHYGSRMWRVTLEGKLGERECSMETHVCSSHPLEPLEVAVRAVCQDALGPDDREARAWLQREDEQDERLYKAQPG